MGDDYEFDCRIIDGREVCGFAYRNDKTGWNEIFVEFTDEQKAKADEWTSKHEALFAERDEMIKDWIGIEHT